MKNKCFKFNWKETANVVRCFKGFHWSIITSLFYWKSNHYSLLRSVYHTYHTSISALNNCTKFSLFLKLPSLNNLVGRIFYVFDLGVAIWLHASLYLAEFQLQLRNLIMWVKTWEKRLCLLPTISSVDISMWRSRSIQNIYEIIVWLCFCF